MQIMHIYYKNNNNNTMPKKGMFVLDKITNANKIMHNYNLLIIIDISFV